MEPTADDEFYLLEEEQRLCGVIAYGSFDIGRVATSKEKKGKQCEDAE